MRQRRNAAVRAYEFHRLKRREADARNVCRRILGDERVVIRQRLDADTALGGAAHEVRRREGAIRADRMGVQVDRIPGGHLSQSRLVISYTWPSGAKKCDQPSSGVPCTGPMKSTPFASISRRAATTSSTRKPPTGACMNS